MIIKNEFNGEYYNGEIKIENEKKLSAYIEIDERKKEVIKENIKKIYSLNESEKNNNVVFKNIIMIEAIIKALKETRYHIVEEGFEDFDIIDYKIFDEMIEKKLSENEEDFDI